MDNSFSTLTISMRTCQGNITERYLKHSSFPKKLENLKHLWFKEEILPQVTPHALEGLSKFIESDYFIENKIDFEITEILVAGFSTTGNYEIVPRRINGNLEIYGYIYPKN